MINHQVATKAGSELSANITSTSPESSLLDLAATNLFTHSVAAIKAFFATLQPKFSHLDLSDNPLSRGSERSFAEIPSHISSVYLWFNELFEKSGSELKSIFSSFNPNISFVDLSYNKLGYKRAFELNQAFSGFSPFLRSVRLSNNHFPDMHLSALEIAFSGLPATIEELDFSDDKSLRFLNNEQLEHFLQAIPKTVRTIDLSHNKLFKGKTLEEKEALLQSLKKIDPLGSRLNLSHNGQSLITKASPDIVEHLKPREQVDSILQTLPSTTAPEKQVSKYSFFSQVSTIKEAAPAPACDFLPKP